MLQVLGVVRGKVSTDPKEMREGALQQFGVRMWPAGGVGVTVGAFLECSQNS